MATPPPNQRDFMGENYPEREEEFAVVLLKKGVNQAFANVDDFDRVPVTAKDPISAQTHEDVLNRCKEGGFVVLHVAKPNVLTDPEIHAHRRAIEGPPTDRSRVGMEWTEPPKG